MNKAKRVAQLRHRLGKKRLAERSKAKQGADKQ